MSVKRVAFDCLLVECPYCCTPVEVTILALMNKFTEVGLQCTECKKQFVAHLPKGWKIP